MASGSTRGESYALDQTGLASVQSDEHAARTTDGEAFDQTAMAAAHQTLQLPAIVRVTNLQNGRQVLVRVNDRGPISPHRVIALTERAAGLLGIPDDGAAEVRVQVDDAASRALTDQLGGGAPKLAMVAAPLGVVRQEALSSPGQSSSPVQSQPAQAKPAPPPATTKPRGLPAQMLQGAPNPGLLWLSVGQFSRIGYANQQRALLAPYGQIDRIGSGRGQMYQVKAGPFTDVAQADAALDRALRAGLTDARIVVQ